MSKFTNKPSPATLREVSGIGPDRSPKIVAAWEEQKRVKEIMLFLHEHGDSALEIVQANPYQLERDIYGIGFKTADNIAQALGLTKEHPSRIEVGLVFALNETINNGHVYNPRQQLAQCAAEILEVSLDLIPPALDRLAEDKRIRPEILSRINVPENKPAQGLLAEPQAAYGTPVIYLTPFYFGAKGVAERLRKMLVSNALL